MGLAIVVLIFILFTAAKKGANEGARFAKPYVKPQLLMILVILAAFIALASSGGK